MNYAFDITLNFNDELIDFYDWNKNDKVMYFLKIPLFKVENKVLLEIINNKIIISKEIVNIISSKTEIYDIKDSYNYCIITDTNTCLGLKIDDNGYVIEKSFLLLEEAEDINEFSKLMKYSLLDYKIVSKQKNNVFLTRKERNIKKNTIDSINNFYSKKEYEKLKYIYFELYDKKELSINLIVKKLLNIIDNNSEKTIKLDSIINELNKKSTYST